jgi:hypothetical protein
MIFFTCRSVLRTDRDEQSAHDEMKLSDEARMDSDMQTGDSTLIDYELFCNDIYVCDWA